MPLRFLPVPPLTSLDEPGAWMLEGIHQVITAAQLEVRANTDTLGTARTILADTLMDSSHQTARLIAVDGDDKAECVIGTARATFPVRSNPTLAHLELVIHPAHRGQGAGRAMAEWLERTAAERGRTSWLVSVQFAPPGEGEETITIDRGDAMPVHTPGLSFALARGYTLRQIDRQSRLDLPVSPELIRQLWEGSQARIQGYQVRSWAGAPPDEWLDKISRLTTAMSTDPPQGGVTTEEDPWDAGRLQEHIARRAASGRDTCTTAAEDLRTGELVAVTDIAVDRTGGGWAEQGDTIVRRDHRGHRLGMAIKIANLHLLGEQCAETSRLYTWNASENSHMLAINIALGFYPVGGAATLQQGD